MNAGDILYCKIPFADHTITSYPRFYVVVKANTLQFSCLNLSSIEHKEHKLAYPSNKEVHDCIPPMYKRTMVKLDEEYVVSGAYNNDLIFGCFEKPIMDVILDQEERYKSRPDSKYQVVNSRIIN